MKRTASPRVLPTPENTRTHPGVRRKKIKLLAAGRLLQHDLPALGAQPAAHGGARKPERFRDFVVGEAIIAQAQRTRAVVGAGLSFPPLSGADRLSLAQKPAATVFVEPVACRVLRDAKDSRAGLVAHSLPKELSCLLT